MAYCLSRLTFFWQKARVRVLQVEQSDCDIKMIINWRRNNSFPPCKECKQHFECKVVDKSGNFTQVMVK